MHRICYRGIMAPVLYAAMLICLPAVSCGKPAEAAAQTSAGDTGAAAPEEESFFEADSLPDGLDFEGKTVTVLYREEDADEFFMEKQTGEVVDDAVYLSNSKVTERLNIAIGMVLKKGSSETDRTAFINYVGDTVMAGDSAFDIAAGLTYNMPVFVQKGLLMNLRGLPYIDFDKPWWAQGLVEYGTIGGSLFFASGDISLSLIKKTFCVYYNKDLPGSLGMDPPGESVLSGKWTFDAFSGMAKEAYGDLNGSREADFEDRYGFALYDRNHCNLFIGGFDLRVTDKDEDGLPVLVFGNEKTADAVTLLCGFFHNNSGIYYNKNSDAGADLSVHQTLANMFTGSRLLFISAEFGNALLYRDMNDEYGVLPPPKRDEAQDGYYTLARNVYSSFGVPLTNTDTELAGAFMEAAASENHRTLAPVYFETALKVKYARSEESALMFDIIKSGMKFNLGYTYHQVVGITDLFVDSIRDNKTDWASVYASKEKTSVSNIEKFIAAIEEMR